MKTFLSSTILLFAVLWTVSAQDEIPRMCPSGLHEVPYDAAVCPKCGKDLSGVPVPGRPAETPGATAPASASVTPPATTLPPDVEDLERPDLKIIFRTLSKNPAAQLAAVRNLMLSLSALPDGAPADRLQAASEPETKLLATLAKTSKPCLLCHGTGIVTIKPLALPPTPKNGNVKSIESVSVEEFNKTPKNRTCPFCGGSGSRACVRDRKELLGLLRLGAKDYERTARTDGSGRTDLRGIFLPPSLATSLSVEAQAALFRRSHEFIDCETCAGTSMIPCTQCKGFGVIPCDNAAFHNSPVPARKTVSQGDVRRIEDAVLSPVGVINETCPMCKGRRNEADIVPCPACAGKGLSVCSECNGSGERPKCGKCHGDGIVTDKTDGRILCETCGGSGHDR